MGINSDNPFAKLILSPRTAMPAKVSEKARKQAQTRRDIEAIKDRLALKKELEYWDDLTA